MSVFENQAVTQKPLIVEQYVYNYFNVNVLKHVQGKANSELNLIHSNLNISVGAVLNVIYMSKIRIKWYII